MVQAKTPVMRQFAQAKAENPDALLFFRMGDFYELFYDDAEEASRLLDITLTARKDGIPMAGVPVRAADTYLRRLVSVGRRVAICEQIEDAKQAKGLVDRAVVRVVTPGTLTEESDLERGRPNYLAAIVRAKESRGRPPGSGGLVGLGWVELSTGAFELEELPEEALADELARLDPAEVLVAESLVEHDAAFVRAVEQDADAPTHAIPDWRFQREDASRVLREHYGVADLGGFGLDDFGPALQAAGALLAYLQETQKTALPHLRPPRPHRRDDHVAIDRVSLRCLEVVANSRDGGRSGTVLSAIDRTRTAMGARLLRTWLTAPLQDVARVAARQDAVEELVCHPTLRSDLRDRLRGVQDLERLVGRVATRRANPRDLLALGRSLEQVPGVRELLAGVSAAKLLSAAEQADPVDDLRDAILRTVRDDAPISLRDGGIVRKGVHPELDELRGLAKDAKQYLADLQAREIERTGISTLRVGYTSVFGYFIEVTRARADKVPDDYRRRQTLKNVERYITPELKEYEAKVLSADDRSRTLEEELVLALREQAADAIPRLQACAGALAQIDVLTSFAEHAVARGWTRPVLDESGALDVRAGRHPVLEAADLGEPFVPNDVGLDADGVATALLTGPNMSGKSTYIRQVALLALLAHTGSFLPAERAHIGRVDRIFARVGASDDLSRGRSTFMVEMMETANILHHATARSLVVLDEVGRGTSTYDGVALAWAITEDLAARVRCRTLFATHYHELTALPETGEPYASRIRNYHVAVREWGDRVVFLHRIEPGGTDRSYGLHVARLAGVPGAVVERAERVLQGLERAPAAAPAAAARGAQLELFAAPEDPILAELRRTVLDETTPLSALGLLARWQRVLSTSDDQPARGLGSTAENGA